jgi:hypothetical protein
MGGWEAKRIDIDIILFKYIHKAMMFHNVHV